MVIHTINLYLACSLTLLGQQCFPKQRTVRGQQEAGSVPAGDVDNTLCCRQRQLSCVDAGYAVTLALSARNGAFSNFFALMQG